MIRKNNIGIITIPISKAGLTPLNNFVEILHSLSYNINIITGGAGYSFYKNDSRIQFNGYRINTGKNLFFRIINNIIAQFCIMYRVVKTSKDVNFFVFFIGGTTLALPMFAAKLCRKKVLLLLAGSDVNSIQSENVLLSLPMRLMGSANLLLSDKIILYSNRLIESYGLKDYRNKIHIANHHFIKFNEFHLIKQINERENLIGYIGRLSVEKGITNLIEAVPKLIEDNNKIMICGDGKLFSMLTEMLDEQDIDHSKVKLTGWISHDELPKYLNRFKLLVLPSYTEGLPNIMLEAMACGTPVLATAVGAIPDVIIDGETGFLLENNSPECIAESVLRILSLPIEELECISENARNLIEKEFNFENTIAKWKKVFKSIEGHI